MVKFKTDKEYKKITLDDAITFLEENGTPEEKKAFKVACTTVDKKTGKEKINWLKGKKYFCEKYAPELVPVAKPKPEKKSLKMLNW